MGTVPISSTSAFEAKGIADPGARRFFVTLLLATLLPYLWLPISLSSWPEVGGETLVTAIFLFIGAQAHVGASLYFYTDKEMRTFMLRENPRRFVFAVVGIALAYPLASVLVGQLPRSLLKQDFAYLLIAGYWTWQAHHYARQNHGILAFLSRANGVPLSGSERRAVSWTSWAGVAGVVAFITHDVGHVGPLRELFWGASAVLMIAGWSVWLSGLLRDRRPAPWSHHGALALTLAFFLPVYFFDTALLAVLTFATAHGLQYFVFMGHVTAPRRFGWRPFAMAVSCALLFGGALLLAAKSSLFTVGLGFVMAHFVLDAGVWKLSQPFQRSYMSERFDFLR